MQQKRSEQQKKDQPKDGQQTENNRKSEGAMPPAEAGPLNGRKGKGQWGRLPGKVIEQMYDNGNRKLPSRYRHLLEEYFRRLPVAGGGK